MELRAYRGCRCYRKFRRTCRHTRQVGIQTKVKRHRSPLIALQQETETIQSDHNIILDLSSLGSISNRPYNHILDTCTLEDRWFV
jgi:hypothetical protein